MKSGVSPDNKSVGTRRIKTGAFHRVRSSGSSSSNAGGSKEFLKRLVDYEEFYGKIQDWLQEKLLVQDSGHSYFEPPFELDELRQFDYALENIQFQQLLRMPPMHLASTTASLEAEMCLAMEDFLYTSSQGLWETFWSSEDPLPFFVSGSHSLHSKAFSGENLSRGGVGGPHCAALVGKTGGGANMLWDNMAEFVILKSELMNESKPDGPFPAPTIIAKALFLGLHMLLSRKSANNKSAIRNNIDTAYILLVDTQFGGVVRLRGDVNELDVSTSKVYESASGWVQGHAHVAISTVDPVWNRFGNANWGDLGALHLLLATFHSMEQYVGPSKRSIAELAADHNTRLQNRKIERRILQVYENGGDPVSHQHSRGQGEIIEIEEDVEPQVVKELEQMKLESGTVLWLEDAHWQRGFKIHGDLGDGQHSIYSATSLDDPGKLLNVFVGAHPSQLEPSWEDMSTWYQVQRQTRVLNVIKQRGISSKYLPQLVASGRILHPGSCTKQSPGGRCGHPWCGTPILVTSPVGESLDRIVGTNGVFSPEAALRCCHDCLSALQIAGSVGIQHGDITPQHVIRVMAADGDSYYVLVEWGHAILEDRDSPGISPQFSSTYALQEGKLCPASDAESLVYLVYFLCGGSAPQFDSIESALQWRERSWARRAIQQKLGEVSAVLKAFADYVDSLCGTPYPIDYDIWLKRLSRAFHGEDFGKRIDHSTMVGRSNDVAESSSRASFS